MNLLSIDWDYFIDATNDERMSMFPDGGNENLPLAVLHLVWVSKYANSMYMWSIGDKGRMLEEIDTLSDEIQALKTLIRKHTVAGIPVVVAESHKEIEQTVNELYDKAGQVNVVNIDFHDDCFPHYKALDCGNWVRVLNEQGKLGKIQWIKSDGSHENGYKQLETCCDGINGYVKTLSKDFKFDAIFICRSGCWSPPHLDYDFAVFVADIESAVKSRCNFAGEILLRWNSEVRREIEDLFEQMKEGLKKIKAG